MWLMSKKYIGSIIITLIFCGIFSVEISGQPNNLQPVNNFDLTKYLGKWYEIGRYDHSFERGLDEVTAEYSLRKDNKVRVLNSGQRENADHRKSNEGYAVFVDKTDVGELKVTFFWPFFGLYRIAELGENYDYAVVVGEDFDYLWILSRTPKMEPAKLNAILERLKSWGFDLAKIYWIKQKT